MKRLLVFSGLIASGKSTLAAAFAKQQACRYYNTDRVRKELAGIAAGATQCEDMGQGIYRPEFTRKTYGEMITRAQNDFAAGKNCVVLDGSYQQRAERDLLRHLAESCSAQLIFILCVCDEAETKRRLEERARDQSAVSDGRWEIYLRQRENFQMPSELDQSSLIHIDSNDNVERLLLRLEILLAAVITEAVP